MFLPKPIAYEALPGSRSRHARDHYTASATAGGFGRRRAVVACQKKESKVDPRGARGEGLQELHVECPPNRSVWLGAWADT